MSNQDCSPDQEFVDYLMERAHDDAKEIATFANIFKEEISELLVEKGNITNIIFGIMMAAANFIKVAPQEIKNEMILAYCTMLTRASLGNKKQKKKKKKK